MKKSGIGYYCLMCWGDTANPKNPTHVNPYLKLKAGWLGSLRTLNREFQELETSGTDQPELSLTAEAGKNQFFRYNKGDTDSTEYFLIENRCQTGRDAALPDSGLAIWHIDELGDNTWRYRASDNMECALVQADGRFDLETSSSGDTTDLFAAGEIDCFGSANDPCSRWWDGSPLGLQIKSIGPAGPSMHFTAVATGNPDLGFLTITAADGVNLRIGPSLDYALLLPGHKTRDKRFLYRINSLVADKNGLTWAEVQLDPPVDWISQGWLCVKQGLKYYTSPHLDVPTVPPPAFAPPFSSRTTVTVTAMEGVRVRTGPGLNFAMLIPASRTRNRNFVCISDSQCTDNNGYTWIEVNLSRFVNGYSKGWLALGKGTEDYVTFAQE